MASVASSPVSRGFVPIKLRCINVTLRHFINLNGESLCTKTNKLIKQIVRRQTQGRQRLHIGTALNTARQTIARAEGLIPHTGLYWLSLQAYRWRADKYSPTNFLIFFLACCCRSSASRFSYQQKKSSKFCQKSVIFVNFSIIPFIESN